MRVAKELRSGNYDLAINLRLRSWWISVLLYLARIPRRIGYASKLSAPFLTQAPAEQPREHLTVSSLRLISAGLQALDYPPLDAPYAPERYPLHFTPAEEDQHWVGQRLRAEGIDPSAPLIVIHPGSGAVGSVGSLRIRAQPVLSGGYRARSFHSHGDPAGQPLLEAIAQATTAPITMMTGMTTGQLAALLKRVRLVLGVDSGPLHLAVAMRTPTVRIYGPIDPCMFGPWGSPEQHAVVLSTHRCSTCAAIPCGHLSFPWELAAHPCVWLVPEQEVLTPERYTVPRGKSNSTVCHAVTLRQPGSGQRSGPLSGNTLHSNRVSLQPVRPRIRHLAIALEVSSAPVRAGLRGWRAEPPARRAGMRHRTGLAPVTNLFHCP